MSGALTRVSLIFLPDRLNVWLRFGRPVRERRRNPSERDLYFTPPSIFALVEWQGNEYGTVHWALQVLQAAAPGTPVLTVPRVKPGAEILLRVGTPDKVRRVLGLIDGIEGHGIAPIAVSSSYWRTVHNRLAANREPPVYTPERLEAAQRRAEFER
jgi:hypothetical protein